MTDSKRKDMLAIIERPFAAYVLLALAEHPYSSKTEIMRLEEGNERAKFARLLELEEAGLMEYRVPEGKKIPKMYLTEEGAAVVRDLRHIDAILRGPILIDEEIEQEANRREHLADIETFAQDIEDYVRDIDGYTETITDLTIAIRQKISKIRSGSE